jgi:anthranilate/para-aminobenzoate synthase component I
MPRVYVEALDLEDGPADVAVRLAARPGLAWLDADGSDERGRYAFVGSDPVQVRRRLFGEGEPLGVFEELGAPMRERPQEPGANEGPPHSRVPAWAGYIAYDAAWAAPMRIAPVHARAADSTVAWFARYDAWAAFDLREGRAWLLGDDAGACARLRARIRGSTRNAPWARAGMPAAEPPDLHLAAIDRALELIFAGDLYQVNLARRWTAPFEGTPLALMLAMRRQSPVPLGFYLDAGDHAVVSGTMESFLEWDGRGTVLRTRPIKGTVARAGHDADEARALRADAKERAEHSMIVDLMRNDFGRLAQVGSVNVADLMAVEPFAGLHHLVSTVACTPRDGTTLRQILEATFPPGSVTGAPKVRAVERIEQLERSPRGVYCGALGHVSRAGGVRLAVAIRTAVVRGGEACYHAGGGIVEASDPGRELAETELKARVFLDALVHLGEHGPS